MLALDIATYIAAAGLSLTVGTSLYTLPFPVDAPERAVSVIETGGLEAVRTFGTGAGSPIFERPTFQVKVRDGQDNADAARTLAQSIYAALDNLGPVTLPPSNVLYSDVTAIQPPFYLGVDTEGRHLFCFNCRAWKARG